MTARTSRNRRPAAAAGCRDPQAGKAALRADPGSGKPVQGGRWHVIAGEAAAADLPPRAAHVMHALMARWSDADGSGPLTAAEVCEYDIEALTVRHTAAALARARQFGLAELAGPGLWTATNRAWMMRAAIEERFRTEVPDA